MEQKKKKTSKGIIIFIIAFLLVGAGIIYGLYMRKTPRAVFQESYNYLTKGFKDLDLDELQIGNNIKSDKIKATSNIKLEINESLGLGIKEIDLGLILQEDKYNKTGSYTITSQLDSTKLLDGKLYQKDNKLYLTVNEIMDKYYYMDQEFISLLVEEEYDFDVLVDIVSKNLKEQIKDSDFEKEEVTTEIDGKEESVTKLSLKITNELAHRVGTAILEDIKTNEEALNLIAKLSEMSKEEVITSIDEALNEELENKEEVLYTYNIYHKKSDIKKLELVSEEEVITYTANNDKYEMVIDASDEGTVRFFMEKEGEKLDFTLDAGTTTSLAGTLEKKDNKYQGNIKVFEEEQELMTITIETEKKSANESYVKLGISMQGVNYGTISINTKIDSIETIEIEDLTPAKKLEEMTEEEQNQMIINLMNHPVIGPIIMSFKNLESGELSY